MGRVTPFRGGPLLVFADVCALPSQPESPGLVDVCLAVRQGQIVSVLGMGHDSAARILQLASGFEDPASGAVTFRGRDLATMSSGERAEYRRRELGLLLGPSELEPTPMPLGEHVAAPLLVASVSARRADRAAGRALELVGLSGSARRPFDSLGPYDRRRAAVAHAIVREPSLILVDEPTARLNPWEGSSVLALLRRVACDVGAALLMTTEQPRVAAYGDEIVCLRDGRLQSVTSSSP